MKNNIQQEYEDYLINFLKKNNLCFTYYDNQYHLETGTQIENLSKESIRLFFHLISKKFNQTQRFFIFNDFINQNIDNILIENPENFSINFNSSSLDLSIQQFNPTLRTYYLSNFSFPVSLYYHIQKKEKMKEFITCAFESTNIDEKKAIIKNLLLNCKELNTKKGKDSLLFSLKNLLSNNELFLFEDILKTNDKDNPLISTHKFSHNIFINKNALSKILPLMETKEK